MNKPLKGSFKILDGYFIIIALDESYTSASGCSIDKCMNFIKSLESVYDVDLLDKIFAALGTPTEAPYVIETRL